MSIVKQKSFEEFAAFYGFRLFLSTDVVPTSTCNNRHNE